MTPQREILWNIPPAVMGAVYALSALCAVWIVYWFVRRSRLWKQGAEIASQLSRQDGFKRLSEYLATHREVRRDPYAGWMHALIVWGFIILLIATTLVGIQHHGHLVFLTGTTYIVFKFISNLGGVAFCVGLGMALWRRRSEQAHGRLQPNPAITWLLIGMLALGVGGFLVEAARIAKDFPEFETWSFVGYTIAKVMAAVGLSGERVVPVHRALWILHAGMAIGFFILVPISLLKHIFLASYSVARPAGKPGIVTAPPAPVITGVDLAHFRRVDLIQADACLTCGRCNAVCPAEAVGKPLHPRSVVLGLREHLDHPNVALPLQVSDDMLWSCTSCHACDDACPININILDKIVTMRRGRVAEGELPDTAAGALEATAQKFNPFGQPNSTRMEWAAGLNVPVAKDGEAVELLYWVGCAGAFDPAGREVTKAVVKILNHLKINYRVLGPNERCTGDPARRLGEEGLWNALAKQNQAKFAAHSVKTILTQCPHCYNAFRNEYPALSLSQRERVGVRESQREAGSSDAFTLTQLSPSRERVFEMPQVMHHSQWLRARLDDGSLKLRNGAEKITYHDPCYLSRANRETRSPRAVLDGIFAGKRVEMEQHGKKSFCCGGGGGQVWLDVRGQTRVENLRALQAASTGAQTVATGCPFCRVMLEAGRASLPAVQGQWRVKDIAELVVENLV